MACVLKAKEDVKRGHYADLPPAWKLFPCAHGTQGDLGPGGHACVAELSLLIATRRNGGTAPNKNLLASVRREVRGRVCVSLMRELADQIIFKFANSPRPGSPWTTGTRTPAFGRVAGAGAPLLRCAHAPRLTRCATAAFATRPRHEVGGPVPGAARARRAL